VTHNHPNRTGGLEAIYERPVVVHGHAATSQALVAEGRPPLHWNFEFEERLELGGEQIHLYYPGAGHTRDNIVVWLPRRKLLFVGCLVKSASAQSLSSGERTYLEAWPLAVRRVIERYRDAEILVPGVGEPGGVELLSHTMELLERAQAEVQPATEP
jgi:metallo-beta-lactamase class B